MAGQHSQRSAHSDDSPAAGIDWAASELVSRLGSALGDSLDHDRPAEGAGRVRCGGLRLQGAGQGWQGWQLGVRGSGLSRRTYSLPYRGAVFAGGRFAVGVALQLFERLGALRHHLRRKDRGPS